MICNNNSYHRGTSTSFRCFSKKGPRLNALENFNILFRFNNIIFFICTNSFVHYASWEGFLLFKQSRFLLFLVIHFIVISFKSLVSSRNFLRSRLEDVLFLSHYGCQSKQPAFLFQKRQVVKCYHLPF